MTLLNKGHVSIERFHVDNRTAILSLDLEADYGGDDFEAVSQLPVLLKLLESENVPITIFAEARVLKRFPEMIRHAKNQGVDLQLHCFDHRQTGDTSQSLRKSIQIYQDLVGARPNGYRADTFRLTKQIYKTLIDENFLWDSSILPAAFGFGASREWCKESSGNDYFRFDKKLYEFPVAIHPNIKIPFTHSYQAILRKYPAYLLQILGGLPKLLVYDMHMSDLVWTKSINTSQSIPDSARALYKLSWFMRGKNTFSELASLIKNLRNRGYIFTTLDELYHKVKINDK